jgi:hypothetical protein
MLLDRYTLSKGRVSFRVSVTMMDRCPHRVYSVYHNNVKIFGVLDRPDFDYCHMRLADIKDKAHRELKRWSGGRHGKYS